MATNCASLLDDLFYLHSYGSRVYPMTHTWKTRAFYRDPLLPL